MIKRPLVISGPSGIGKSTLIRSLEGNLFKQALLTVTRPPRNGEKPGEDLEFLDIETYEQELIDGSFFMDNRYFGHAYGIRKDAVESIFREGKIPILTIYTPVIDQFLKEYPNSETIFMMPISPEFLAQRLATRAASEAEFLYRFQKGLEEIKQYEEVLQDRFKRVYKVEGNDNTPFMREIIEFYRFHNSPEGNYIPGIEGK